MKKRMKYATCLFTRHACLRTFKKKKRRKDNIVQVARGVKVSNVTSALVADTCYAFHIINVVSHITFCSLRKGGKWTLLFNVTHSAFILTIIFFKELYSLLLTHICIHN